MARPTGSYVVVGIVVLATLGAAIALRYRVFTPRNVPPGPGGGASTPATAPSPG